MFENLKKIYSVPLGVTTGVTESLLRVALKLVRFHVRESIAEIAYTPITVRNHIYNLEQLFPKKYKNLKGDIINKSTRKIQANEGLNCFETITLKIYSNKKTRESLNINKKSIHQTWDFGRIGNIRIVRVAPITSPTFQGDIVKETSGTIDNFENTKIMPFEFLRVYDRYGKFKQTKLKIKNLMQSSIFEPIMTDATPEQTERFISAYQNFKSKPLTRDLTPIKVAELTNKSY